jgi:hypothetical protein
MLPDVLPWVWDNTSATPQLFAWIATGVTAFFTGWVS